MTIRNPYYSDPPKLLPSFVCHVDILGYSNLSSTAIQSGKGDEFLLRIRDALTEAYECIRGKSDNPRMVQYDFQAQDSFSVKVFSDNIILGYPIGDLGRTLGEGELGAILRLFSKFQISLATKGFLTRGGIAAGNHYMDDDIVFGDALLNAVKFDKSGGAPKVSLHDSAVEALQYHLGFYGGDLRNFPASHELLEDSDGSLFINYLSSAFSDFPSIIYFEMLEKHKETIVKGLKEYSGIPDVRAKYEWSARYHNFVCDEFKRTHPVPTHEVDPEYGYGCEQAQKLDEHLIDIESLAPYPSTLSIKPKRRNSNP